MTNVLVIYTGFIPSVRLCALEPLKVIEKQNKINLYHKPSHRVTAKDLNNCDVIVFVRCSEDREFEIAQKCKMSGRMLVYVLDDDLLNVPEEIDCSDYFSTSNVRGNIQNIMNLCNVLWATNSKLIKKYGSLFEKVLLIDESFVANIFTDKKKNEKIRIGFAGSASHKAFVNEFIGNVVEKIYEKYNDSVSIEFFGFKPEFSKNNNIKYIPYTDDYESYCAVMRERNWDIGLAPLEDSEFDSCKYFNKYIEYSSYGIAGLYSNVQPYTFGIRNGENGILAENTVEAWIEALSKLIDDEVLRKKIVNCSQKELEEKFSPEVIAEIILKECAFLCNHKTNAIIFYRRKSFLFSKLKIYTEKYGIMMPYMAVKKIISKISRR